jgi:hypothetical protein
MSNLELWQTLMMMKEIQTRWDADEITISQYHELSREQIGENYQKYWSSYLDKLDYWLDAVQFGLSKKSQEKAAIWKLSR